MSLLSWLCLPPPDWDHLPQRDRVRGPRGRGALYATLLSDDLHDLDVHYDRDIRRTVPCHGQGCLLCADGIRRDRKGYAAAWCHDTKRPFVLELSRAALVELKRLKATNGQRLRGAEVILRRKGTNVNAQVCVTLRGFDTRRSLSPEFDPRGYVLAMWGLVHRPDFQPIPGQGEPVSSDDGEVSPWDFDAQDDGREGGAA